VIKTMIRIQKTITNLVLNKIIKNRSSVK